MLSNSSIHQLGILSSLSYVSDVANVGKICLVKSLHRYANLGDVCGIGVGFDFEKESFRAKYGLRMKTFRLWSLRNSKRLRAKEPKASMMMEVGWSKFFKKAKERNHRNRRGKTSNR